MPLAVSLSLSLVLFALALSLLWIARAIQAGTKGIQTTLEGIAELQSTSPRKAVSALGDELDALGVRIAAVDKDVQTALSLGRSNRSRITNLQHRDFADDSDEPGEPGQPPRLSIRIPGRTT